VAATRFRHQRSKKKVVAPKERTAPRLKVRVVARAQRRNHLLK
jgi:hypothetical protein